MLLSQLNKINMEVNQQMTAPNHHRDIEQFTIENPQLSSTASTEERKKAIAEATQDKLTKELYKKCEEHDAKEWAERLLFRAQLQDSKKIALGKAKNSKDQTLECGLKYLQTLNHEYQIDEDMIERLKKIKLLTESREQSSCSMPAVALRASLGKKSFILKTGVALRKSKTGIGFCGEFAQLALVKIIRELLGDRVEFIQLNLGDDCDNHAFIAINREKDSDLTEFSTWGEDCIIFDAWNEVVTTVHDYELSLRKMLFIHCIVDAESIEYIPTEDIDKVIFFEREFSVFSTTSYLDIEQRKTVLKQEFELTKIDPVNFSSCHKLFINILDSYKLENYSPEVVFYITTAGTKPVTFVNGFNTGRVTAS